MKGSDATCQWKLLKSKKLDLFVKRRRNSVWTQIKSPPPPPFPAPSIDSRSTRPDRFVPKSNQQQQQQRTNTGGSQQQRHYSYPSYSSKSPPPSYPPPKYARRSVPDTINRIYPLHPAADDPYLPPHVLYQRPKHLGQPEASPYFPSRENRARKISFSNFPPQHSNPSMRGSYQVSYSHQKPTMLPKRNPNQPAKRWLQQIQQNERSRAMQADTLQRRRKSYPMIDANNSSMTAPPAADLSGDLNRNSMGLMNEKAMKAVQDSLVKLEQSMTALINRLHREQGVSKKPLAQVKPSSPDRFMDAKAASSRFHLVKNFTNFKDTSFSLPCNRGCGKSVRAVRNPRGKIVQDTGNQFRHQRTCNKLPITAKMFFDDTVLNAYNKHTGRVFRFIPLTQVGRWEMGRDKCPPEILPYLTAFLPEWQKARAYYLCAASKIQAMFGAEYTCVAAKGKDACVCARCKPSKAKKQHQASRSVATLRLLSNNRRYYNSQMTLPKPHQGYITPPGGASLRRNERQSTWERHVQ
uniref:Uncharacterized protein n=1 Tax=Lotharella oceanica TaxID=641309 RepID=A0A7S2THG2_9EUKA